VTVPLENALNGTPFLKTIRSKSVLGLSSVVLIFQDGTDVLRARQLVQERLSLAQNRLPALVKPPVLMAPYSSLSRALKIGMSSKRLSQAMWLGCALVAVILILFLFDWRTAFISLTAIPLSLLVALLVVHGRGSTINTMVLAGLVIALGEAVDDAIIGVENILRRLRLNHSKPEPEPAFQVVLKASIEVRSAVVYASLLVVLVFLPVFFLEGLAGSFFKPLATTYVLAMLASLGVALTVTPAIGSRNPARRWRR